MTSRRRAVLIIVVIAVAVAIALACWIVWNGRPQVNEVDELVSKVGRIFVLPEDETPAVATVTDETKIQTQLLERARNGDKVLIYQKAGIAIVYRPSNNKIAAVGPVKIEPLNSSAR